ncbi:DUF3006 domain-containing protein [Virgibacillus senegalensis]|uniref:DUF3006 domain-containing protein n=1 Tax=Virgibacillus senegalensis TaxID=1499679 RepID=UPI00069E3EBD|nr:DUF3006 domain-containing protein [Virgibacillus senegalensis]
MKGILDRFEDDKFAVILSEEEEKEFILEKNQLPEGAQVHDWLDFTVKDNEIISIQIDKQKTKAKKEESETMRNRLRGKSKGSKFKRKK